MIWFTSDHHFNHKNIIRLSGRPILRDGEWITCPKSGETQLDKNDVFAMNEMLIDCWNEVVDEGDVVYYLGDFSMGGSKPHSVESLTSKLNGHLILVAGNHDHKKVTNDHGWSEVHGQPPHDYRIIAETFETEYGKSPKVVMSHFPISDWDGAFKGAIHLHGHSHGLRNNGTNTCMDVGVDSSELPRKYYPVSIVEVMEIMERRVYDGVFS